MNKELRRWLVAHDACESGMDEMKALHITDMQDAYNRASPKFLIWVVTQKGVMSRRQCVEFALYCVRQAEGRMRDGRSRDVIPALERWLADEITPAEMKSAADAAYAAADDNIGDAASFVAYSAIDCAVTDANYALEAAFASDSVARDTSGIDCGPFRTAATVRKDQAQWIREHVPFESLNLGRTK